MNYLLKLVSLDGMKKYHAKVKELLNGKATVETGTWTPVINPYNPKISENWYTKIGRLVIFHCYVEPSGNDAKNSYFSSINGLPFASIGTSRYDGQGTMFVLNKSNTCSLYVMRTTCYLYNASYDISETWIEPFGWYLTNE